MKVARDSDSIDDNKFTPIEETNVIPTSLLPDLQSYVTTIKSLKFDAKPLEEQLKPIKSDLEILNKQLGGLLLPYIDKLPKDLLISDTTVSYVKGKETISETLLLEAGVSKKVIQSCKVKGSGYFVVDKKDRKGKE